MSAPPNPGRFAAGDALRGLSALGVMALHVTEFSLGYSQPIPAGQAFQALRAAYGPIGLLALAGGLCLSIFFALSGYLIARPFVASYVRARQPPPLRPYARNRLLRIVPAFWFAVVATLLVFGLTGSSPFVVPLTLAFGQTFVPAEPFVTHIAQGWTLGAELCFYAVVPVVALCLGRSGAGSSRRGARRVLALCLASAVASAAWRSLDPNGVIWTEVFPALAAAFAPGVALAAIEAARPQWLGSKHTRRLALPVALAGLTLLLLGASAPSQYTWWRWIAEATGGGLVLAGALMREWSGAPAWKLLHNRATDWLGQRSYSIYVLHFGVGLWIVQRIAVIGHPGETLLRLAPLTLLTTLGLADLSWRWIEQPFLRWKRRPPVPLPAAGRAR